MAEPAKETTDNVIDIEEYFQLKPTSRQDLPPKNPIYHKIPKLTAADYKKYPWLRTARIYLAVLTPELSKQFLEHNNNNRNLRLKGANSVEYWANTLEADLQKLIGDCIAFDVHGNQINGQHRCHGVIKTGKSMPVFIVQGLCEDAYDVGDDPIVRSASDMLKRKSTQKGVKISSMNAKCAMVSKVVMLNSMKPKDSWSRVRWAKGFRKNDIANYVLDHDRELSWGLSLLRSDRIFRPATSFAALAVYLGSRHKTATKYFFTKLIDGDGLEKGNPILLLAKYLRHQAAIQAAEGTESKAPIEMTLAYVIIVWNAWLSGKSMTKKPVFRKQGKFIDWPIPRRPSSEYQPWKAE